MNSTYRLHYLNVLTRLIRICSALVKSIVWSHFDLKPSQLDRSIGVTLNQETDDDDDDEWRIACSQFWEVMFKLIYKRERKGNSRNKRVKLYIKLWIIAIAWVCTMCLVVVNGCGSEMLLNWARSKLNTANLIGFYPQLKLQQSLFCHLSHNWNVAHVEDGFSHDKSLSRTMTRIRH